MTPTAMPNQNTWLVSVTMNASSYVWRPIIHDTSHPIMTAPTMTPTQKLWLVRMAGTWIMASPSVWAYCCVRRTIRRTIHDPIR